MVVTLAGEADFLHPQRDNAQEMGQPQSVTFRLNFEKASKWCCQSVRYWPGTDVKTGAD